MSPLQPPPPSSEPRAKKKASDRRKWHSEVVGKRREASGSSGSGRTFFGLDVDLGGVEVEEKLDEVGASALSSAVQRKLPAPANPDLSTSRRARHAEARRLRAGAADLFLSSAF
eukprot:1852850-Rhodomonas_salina.1